MKKKSPKKKLKRTTRHLNMLLKTITPSRVIWWQISGIYYGYPKCCIDAFCRLDHIRDEANTGDDLCLQVGNTTGFIPCRNCAERIRNGEMTLKDLIQGRRSPLLFPHCDNEDIDRIYDMVGA